MRNYLVCENGVFVVNSGLVSCSGTLSTTEYNPVEITPQQITEAFSGGFVIFLGIFSVIWGAKHCILYFLR
jgi:hypothetical protein